MDVKNLDPNRVYECKIGEKENGEVEWKGISPLRFYVIQSHQEREVESIMVLNEENHPCFSFHKEDIEGKKFCSEDWIVKPLCFHEDEVNNLIRACESVEELNTLKNSIDLKEGFSSRESFRTQKKILNLEENEKEFCECEDCGC